MFNRTDRKFTSYSQAEIAEVVKDILFLKEVGMTYAEIDGLLMLGRKAKYIMNGTRAKFLLVNDLVSVAA